MTGVLEEFAALTPSWEQMTFAWAVRVRCENAAREASRVSVRVPRPANVIGSSALTASQKRQIVWRAKRRASSVEIARVMGITAPAVRAYLAARSS